jgi:hypothetical protein
MHCSQLASATHLAYGSIYWSRSVLSGQIFNPACGTLTTAVTNNCWYTMTYQFGKRNDVLNSRKIDVKLTRKSLSRTFFFTPISFALEINLNL